MAADDEGYEVGYGKPPKHTRFVKGKSGNPRGRPKKQPASAASEIDEVFDEVCATVSVGGRTKKVTGEEYVWRSLVIAALKGKVSAAKELLYRPVELMRLLAKCAGKKGGAIKNDGLIIVPEILPLDEWEKRAVAYQAKLRRESLEDLAK